MQQRKIRPAEETWRRLAGLIVLLGMVCGLLGSPLCLQAQSASQSDRAKVHESARAASTGATDGTHAEHCGDPCCEHSQPAKAPQERPDCLRECMAAVPLSWQGVVEPVQQVVPMPALSRTAVLSVLSWTVRPVRVELQSTPPLSFAVPLRI
jgi:hypothetical protein